MLLLAGIYFREFQNLLKFLLVKIFQNLNSFNLIIKNVQIVQIRLNLLLPKYVLHVLKFAKFSSHFL